ncbi:lysophospholipid acyltransferase family protein [Brunnivagina elsteri]|uniref:Glycerol acyltransferase n=1 Tax=Brunnivagina elsteri CCALA 953 TaxID=987040 RepID=A0A2A2TRE5_9CYAN|nr:1-acyl-sn-glycerol-3-phosphate acyltransferase [Calothrix elsteri]PAX60728.1 glycerol acyltransferase [Calothrix elsteri CCALA 953]
MPEKIRHAQPPLKFIPPHFNPVFLRLAQWCLPILLRFRLRPWLPAGIARVETKNVETLGKMYQQFQSGKIRFLIAFRHPEVDDPLSVFYLLSRAVPKTGIDLKKPIHSYFVYDRGMTIWAGDWVGWLFSRLGGFPIRRGKRIDRRGLQTAREMLLNGKMPVAIAPEGATNGHSGTVSPLEPGVAQLAFWCVEDLHKANRGEEVFIIPITIQYSYLKPPWQKIDWLLGKLEADSGLPVKSNVIKDLNLEENVEIYYSRLLCIAENLLSQMEEFYQRFYHQKLAEISVDVSASPSQIILARLHRLQDIGLQVAEQYFGVESQGTFIDRCRRLEEAGWSYIYREDLDLDSLPPLKRGLADWVASEADLRMQHMRLVESFVAVTANYITDKPVVERLAETALLIFDVTARLQNNTLPGRPRLGLRQSTVTVGEPISVTKRWCEYEKDKKSARQAVNNLTEDLHGTLQKMIS